ncbi:sn-glycerol-3-phosphate ABC transporter ATP-binding protein UgpC [Egibacter rhizosphaerae]|uniref:sn-glycerol-3-phosphate ABC transporter ATP-binding protein UgpC n=1 Tax=Egibacter rhizosphaerae TaxID=1670831 RepID=A0A411YIX0_9ACTN|nr:sn-glycerol-3-phosphate ABC transporter ATP-binding protein UgpC [Egibacter rhizosphaerae]QBI21026.1 sn-glycerol-3-phosphate ABC transporter ATP-binding protein UgpC [Egibacter rhizosphaerae]
MATVTFDGIWKRFPDGTEAVKELNLNIDDGEFVILVGPSGCGKSTALRMVAGLEDISEGKMLIGDQVVNHLTPKERDIAMVFQSYALYPHMSVAENMGFALKLAKIPKDEIERRVNEAADILGLTEFLHRKPKALSGGQRQRVAMGRAIVRNPMAFLMDEPLSNLDAKLRVQMRAEIAQLQQRLGVTTLYVTHDQVEAMTMGDRVAVLKLGELQQVDAPQQLYDNPRNLFVAGFIGSPSMNIAEGHLERGDDGPHVQVGSFNIRLPDAAFERYPRLSEYFGHRLAVGMRPEHFIREVDELSEDMRFRAEVRLVEALGSEMLMHFKTDSRPVISEDIKSALDDEDAFAELERTASEGQDFTGRFDPSNPPKPGDTVELGFRADQMHFFDYDSGHALREVRD